MSETPWRNRIKELRYVDSADLLGHELNFRLHPPPQVAALRGVLSEIGIANALIGYESPAHNGAIVLLDGHLRQGQGGVWPVLILDVDDDEALVVLATLDEISRRAEVDSGALDALLREVSTGEAAVQQLLADMAERAGIVPEFEIGGGGDEFDTTPEDGPTRAQLGDIWRIGGVHRLAVGDCTDPALVARLMQGERLSLIVTDPPYGVSYADKNRYLNAVAPANRIQVPIVHDHEDITTIAETLWRPAFATMFDAAARGCSLYCFMPQGGDQMMMMMMMSAHWPPRHELIWVKNNHVLGRADYAYKHEPIVFAWKDQGHMFYGGFQTSLLEYDKPQKSDLHPTTKPVDLIAHLIRNSSAPGDLVGDWFLGSGTTMAAAHTLGRRCFGCEIVPRYADVVLRRMESIGLSVEREE